MRLLRALFPTLGLLVALLGGGAVANMPSTGGGLLIASQPPFIQASCSGCSITTNGNQRIYTFTGSGSFTVSYVPPGQTADVLIVGGAGGSGCVASSLAGYAAGASGGAGGVRLASGYSLTPQVYTVTVGAAGTRCSSGVAPTAGNPSTFDTITCRGGGYGGYALGGYQNAGGTNVAHGGGGTGGTATAGGTGTSSGGCSFSNGGPGGSGSGGTGGGALSGGTVGTTGAPLSGVAGVSGLTSSISGASVIYGCSGGSGAYQAGTAGAAGCATAGAGGVDHGNGGSATANTGSSGGGGGGTFGSVGITTAGLSAAGTVIVSVQFQ